MAICSPVHTENVLPLVKTYAELKQVDRGYCGDL